MIMMIIKKMIIIMKMIMMMMLITMIKHVAFLKISLRQINSKLNSKSYDYL